MDFLVVWTRPTIARHALDISIYSLSSSFLPHIAVDRVVTASFPRFQIPAFLSNPKMTTSEPKETPVKPEIPALNLSEAQEVPRKKTFTEKVKGIKETVKRAVTPRSRSASMNEEDLTAAAAKKAKTEVEEVGAEAKSEADKPTYAQMAKKATKAVKKTLGMEPTKKEEEEAQADAASTLSKEKKEKKEKNGTVAGGVAGGLVAVGLLILGVVLSKAGAKPAEPVVEKKKKSFGFGK